MPASAAANTACVPHSASATTRTWGNAPVPWSLDGLPNRAVLTASSGASKVVPSTATSRHDR
jgi:hypothetical protein